MRGYQGNPPTFRERLDQGSRRWHGVLVILGREHEMQAVEAVLASARDGRATSLLLVGLPGIGKTTLLDEAEGAAAAAGTASYRATAVESESGIPGSGLSLLRPLLGEADLVDPWTLLSALTRVASDRPLLVVLDDVQWLDDASLSTLDFVSRRLADDAIALLAAARPEIDDPPRLTSLPRLAVEPLARTDSVALLQAISPGTSVEVATAIADSLGDVPLGLVEAPSLLPHDVLTGRVPLPTALPLGRSVTSRYARGVDALPATARRGLVLAAAEDTGDPAVLAQALEAAALTTADLRPAVDSGLLLPGTQLRFRHPLVRAAIHSGATEAERREAHALLAEVHRTTGDDEMRLRHAAAAADGPDEALAAELEDVVPDVAARRGVGAAAALAAEAAARSPRPEDRWRRLVLAVELGRHRTSAAATAHEVIDRCSDPDLRARAAAVLAEEHLSGPEQLALLEEAIGWVPRGPTAYALAGALQVSAIQAIDTATVVRVAALLGSWDDDEQLPLEPTLTLAASYFFLGRTEEAIATLRRGIALGDDLTAADLPIGSLWAWTRSVAFLGDIPWDEPPLAGRKRAAVARLRATREPMWSATADLLDCWEAFDQGRLGRASSLARSTRPLLTGTGWLDADLLEVVVLAASRRGRDAEAEEASAEFEVLCRDLGMRMNLHGLATSAALRHLRVGRAEAAVELLAPLRSLPGTAPQGANIEARALLVEALAAVDDIAQALTAAIEFEELVRHQPSPVLRAWAQLGHALAGTDDVDARFSAAVALGRECQSPWELARILLHQGEWLRRQRRPGDARAPLREAARLFRQSDAEPWAERAERELAAAGEASSAAQAAQTVDLTPQELRIAVAVADGLSNNEIAATVFLSVKTVETHLTRIYRKLGVRSRGGVAKALADARVGGGTP